MVRFDVFFFIAVLHMICMNWSILKPKRVCIHVNHLAICTFCCCGNQFAIHSLYSLNLKRKTHIHKSAIYKHTHTYRFCHLFDSMNKNPTFISLIILNTGFFFFLSLFLFFKTNYIIILCSLFFSDFFLWSAFFSLADMQMQFWSRSNRVLYEYNCVQRQMPNTLNASE